MVSSFQCLLQNLQILQNLQNFQNTNLQNLQIYNFFYKIVFARTLVAEPLSFS